MAYSDNMRILQGILLSLAVHFLLIIIAKMLPVPQPNAKPIEVTLLENPSQSETHRQVVREQLLPEKLKVKESDDPLKFLSSQTQRVKKQTRAALSGMTKNRDNNAKEAKENQDKNSSGQQHSLDPRRPGTLDAFAPQYKKAPSLSQSIKADRGLSTIGEALPQQVQIGSFTALNTDRYLYYSFYARIEEAIRFSWEGLIQNAIATTPRNDFNRGARNVWITQLEIWLKPNGEIHSSHIMKESGIKGFDQAAIRAFTQARMFPNPPKEMVESDGLIHLKYAFHVSFDPRSLIER